MKVGLMGCGKVACYGHIPAIQESESLELLAVFDPTEEGRRLAIEKLGVPQAFGNIDDFFASGIEAVTIASPAPFHHDNVLACARYRLPALCEKPLAMSGAEGKAMVAAMRDAGVPLHAAFCYRFSPCALQIRDLVRSGSIGDVRSLRLIYNWNLHGKFETAPDGSRILHRRREGRMEEGGPMVDCGTHQIDLATFWLGSEVVRFHGHGAWVDGYEAPDHMWLHLDHASGAHTVVEISYSYHHTTRNVRSEFVYELIGSEGVIRYDRQAARFTLEDGDGGSELPFFPEKSFPGLYRAWSEFLHTGSSDLLTSGEAGLRVAEIARLATDEVIQRRLTSGLAG